MSRLIIGHTTHNSVRIWVRGDRFNPVAFINVSADGMSRNRKMTLEERFGFTGVFDFGTLQPDTAHQCKVTFGRTAEEPEITRAEYGHTTGAFKTFPANSDEIDVRFLLGSCNLHSLGLWQNPDDSFRTLLSMANAESVDFMIHTGDQIYYDIPNFIKWPHFEEYREKYLDAWGDSRPTRKFLTQLPHYMILDDHELVNNFANDMEFTRSGASPGDIKKHGIRVYREFQHIHNPDVYGNQALYYNFNHGGIRFFCLDTRSERIENPDSGRSMMIDDVQMGHFKSWLTRNKDALKFVITSVPFVGHVENNKDKWCGAAFLTQRDEIIQHVLDRDIKGLTFLTGDMHNSYHATLEATSGDKSTVIHELMASPINQTSKSSFGKYLTPHTMQSASIQGLQYTSTILASEFFNDHSNAMLVKAKGNRITYEVFRTRTGKRREMQGNYRV